MPSSIAQIPSPKHRQNPSKLSAKSPTAGFNKSDA